MTNNTIELPRVETPFNVSDEVAQKFWDLVDKSAGVNGCWPWAGTIRSDGYGNFRLAWDESPQTAHRVAWQIANSQKLSRLEYVCHACDNPPCCNPRHLWVGSPQANMSDAKRKGRLEGRGTGILKPRKPKPSEKPSDLPIVPVRVYFHRNHPRVKLSAEQVLEIRLKRKAGARVSDLAAEYGISARSIHNIVVGKTWA